MARPAIQSNRRARHPSGRPCVATVSVDLLRRARRALLGEVSARERDALELDLDFLIARALERGEQ